MDDPSGADAATPSLLRVEWPLLFVVLTATIFVILGKDWLADLSSMSKLAGLFVWLFAAILTAAFGVVRHADPLAIKLGEPYGTLILTLSVTSIEVLMIAAVMLTGANEPTLARDTMFAVAMIHLNGLVGLSLLYGGLRHGEQEFNLQGANAYLAVIVPLAVLGLVLPNYTQSTDQPTLSTTQAALVVLMFLGLYAVFLAIQTVRLSHVLRSGRGIR